MQTVKIWNTNVCTRFPIEFIKTNIDNGVAFSQDKSLVSSTEAHSDFVKCVLSIPKLKLLVSSGSDKVVRFWSAHFQ